MPRSSVDVAASCVARTLVIPSTMFDVRTLIAVMALGTIVWPTHRVFRLTVRRARDLGVVSEHWVVQHRGEGHDPSAR